MDFDIVLFEQLESLEMFSLEGLSNMIFTLDHGTVECWLDSAGIWLLKQNVVTHQDVRHPVDTGNVFVETVQIVTEDAADVAAKVGGESSNIMFRETNTSDVFRQADGH